jgi:uncharacterized protein (DUF952 family)
MPAEKIVFKIVAREAWEAACRDGAFKGSPDDARDGYIHFSAPAQVRGTAEKYFKGIKDLLLVAFDEADLPALVWEPARGGELFPHLYAPLPTALALWEKPLALAPDGAPIISQDMLAC